MARFPVATFISVDASEDALDATISSVMLARLGYALRSIPTRRNSCFEFLPRESFDELFPNESSVSSSNPGAIRDRGEGSFVPRYVSLGPRIER